LVEGGRVDRPIQESSLVLPGPTRLVIMNSANRPIWLRLSIAAFAILALLPDLAARANEKTPGAPENRGVLLVEDERSATLTNRDLRLVFDKRENALISLAYRGRELLGLGKGYVQTAMSAKDKRRGKWQFHLCRREPALVEIAFVNADAKMPFDMETHYILRADEPGFHTYFVLGHDAKRSPGVQEIGQWGYCLRADPQIFTHGAVDDQRIGPLPRPKSLRAGHEVMNATYRLQDGTIYSKYFSTAAMDERHLVHGLLGDRIGLWLLMPSHEHLNGGPEHQELTMHQTDTTPVLLRHYTAAHYGAGHIVSDSRQGSWSKASATWLIYVNADRPQAELWEDAKARAQQEARQWPYPWLDPQQFQLRRGCVSGRLAFDDRSPAGNSRVILAPHEDNPSDVGWQQQWRGYRFYSWTAADGGFTIEKVRPGLYDLYAWQPGRFGQFVHPKVRVEAEQVADLGEFVWNLPHGRQLLWQIGEPDRSAGEFAYANHFRQWGLWDTIAREHPQEVVFVLGRSQDRELPFEMAVTQGDDFAWRSPVWHIDFDAPVPRSGRCLLTLGIAAFDAVMNRAGGLKVSLNGAELARIHDLVEGGAAHRSGLWGVYQERQVRFDASKLKPAGNRLTLEMAAPSHRPDKPLGYPAAAILWDCLRLERE
jgi:rhamnogalacturonan endolyase